MLEDGRYDELPARPYAIGFVRSYAKYLGLPVDDMVARFREEIDDLQAPPMPQKLAMANASTRNELNCQPLCLRSAGRGWIAFKLDAVDCCRQ